MWHAFAKPEIKNMFTPELEITECGVNSCNGVKQPLLAHPSNELM